MSVSDTTPLTNTRCPGNHVHICATAQGEEIALGSSTSPVVVYRSGHSDSSRCVCVPIAVLWTPMCGRSARAFVPVSRTHARTLAPFSLTFDHSTPYRRHNHPRLLENACYSNRNNCTAQS